MRAAPGGFRANHSINFGICSSNPPVRRNSEHLQATRSCSQMCELHLREQERRSRLELRSIVRPIGNAWFRQSQRTHSPRDESGPVALCIGFEPPLRDVVVGIYFGAIGFEYGGHAAHRIMSSLAREEDKTLPIVGFGDGDGHLWCILHRRNSKKWPARVHLAGAIVIPAWVKGSPTSKQTPIWRKRTLLATGQLSRTDAILLAGSEHCWW